MRPQVLLWIYIHYLTITEFGSPVAILVDHWSYDLSFMMFALSREPIRVRSVLARCAFFCS
jgi:hypothetical protein